MLNKRKLILGTGLVVGVACCASVTPTIINYETQNHSSSSNNQNVSDSQEVKRDAYLNYNKFIYGVNVEVSNLQPKTIFDWSKQNESKIIDMLTFSGSGDSDTDAKFENVDFYFWKLNFGSNTDFSFYVRDIQVSRFVSGTKEIYEATIDVFAKPKNGHTWIDDGTSSQATFPLILSNITIK